MDPNTQTLKSNPTRKAAILMLVLGGDLARTAGRLGFVDELEYVQRTYPELFADPETTDRPSGVGEVVFLLEVGYVPQKIQNKLSVPILESDGDGQPQVASVPENPTVGLQRHRARREPPRARIVREVAVHSRHERVCFR